MPALYVERSTEIRKSVAEVVSFLSDLRSWPSWSPWLILEPDCEVTFQGSPGTTGASYRWSGVIIGEGCMTLQEISATSLVISLEFIRPVHSHAHSEFHIKPSGSGSLVTWTLRANLPIFMIFMKSMIEQYLGKDFQRGLKMLKSQMETGSIASHMTLIGTREQASVTYLALSGDVPAAELSSLIPAQIARLGAYTREHDIIVSGRPFTLFEEMDTETGVSQVRICVPIVEPVVVSEPFLCDELPAGPTMVVTHTGAYRFMGNAWALGQLSARHFKVKLKHSPVGFEHYISDPEITPTQDLVTELVLFAR